MIESLKKEALTFAQSCIAEVKGQSPEVQAAHLARMMLVFAKFANRRKDEKRAELALALMRMPQPRVGQAYNLLCDRVLVSPEFAQHTAREFLGDALDALGRPELKLGLTST
jgi:hypothetical protein